MKGATWSVCTHRAPGDPEFATSWNHPMLLFLGQCRMEPVALCLLAAPGATGGITDVWELPGHSCSFLVQAAEAPEDIPPGHPTAASPSLHTGTAPRLQCPAVTPGSRCLSPGSRQSQRPAVPPWHCFGGKQLTRMPWALSKPRS